MIFWMLFSVGVLGYVVGLYAAWQIYLMNWHPVNRRKYVSARAGKMGYKMTKKAPAKKLEVGKWKK